MTKSLIVLGWLRDLVIAFLVVAGLHLRHESRAIGDSILVAAAVVFAERFLWSWHLCALRDAQSAAAQSPAEPEAE
jgi:hypothetical protein